MVARCTKPKRTETVEVFDFPQGGDDWVRARLGLPTASCFADVMAEGEGKTRDKYLWQLVGERLSKEPAETYENEAMRRGRAMEAGILADYAFARGVDVKRVGFVKRTYSDPLYGDFSIGCSPDGLIGEDGLFEAKSMRPDLLAKLVHSGRFPSEHLAQCRGALLVTGRKWCDLRISWPAAKLAPTWRIARDEAYLANLERELEKFCFELDDLTKQVKAKGAIR